MKSRQRSQASDTMAIPQADTASADAESSFGSPEWARDMQGSLGNQTVVGLLGSAQPADDGSTVFRSGHGAVHGDPAAAFDQAASGGPQALPFRAEMEGAFGQDFSSVDVHTGQDEAMGDLGARAAASGESVVFAEANPSKEIVAHEMTHVVQQRGQSPAVEGYGGLSSPNSSAEREAGLVAAEVGAGRPAPEVSASPSAEIHRELSEEEQEQADSASESIIDKLSYGVFDWAITDEEAGQAMAEMSGKSDGQVSAILTKIGSDMVNRLLENLSDSDRHTYAATVAQLVRLRSGNDNVAYVRSLLSYNVFDWAITDSEAQQVLDILMAMPNDQLESLRSLMTEAQWQRLQENLPATGSNEKDLAIVNHRAQQARIAALIQEGLAIEPDPAAGIRDTNNLFHNAAEWIVNGNCTVKIFTPTHDSATRDPSQGIAYFDATVDYPNIGGGYPDDSTIIADPRLVFEDPNTLGGMAFGGATLSIYNPAFSSDAEMKNTFIHEVQHDADQRYSGSVWEQGGGQSTNRYQSEFRAYWLGPSNELPDASSPALNTRQVLWTDDSTSPPTAHTATTSFSNLRQETIFWHLVDSGYDYVPEAYTTDAAFKTMADALTQPTGGNLVDSIRIQNTSVAMESCTSAMAADDPAITALWDTAETLDALDRAFLSNETDSAAFWSQAGRRLSSDAQSTLRNIVRYGTRYPPGDYNLPGETGTAYA